MPRRKAPIDDETEYAAHPRKPSPGLGDTMRIHHYLHMAVSRPQVVSLPEPVVVPRMVNGRPLKSWERGLYVEAVHRQRRAELVLFRGLIG